MNTFDNNNISNYRYFIAKDLIKTNNNVNYIIPTNKNVILNATDIELNAGFEVQSGAELEINNKGCNPNCE